MADRVSNLLARAVEVAESVGGPEGCSYVFDGELSAQSYPVRSRFGSGPVRRTVLYTRQGPIAAAKARAFLAADPSWPEGGR